MAPIRRRRDWERIKAEAIEWERVKAEAAAGRVKYHGVSKSSSGKFKAEIHVNRERKGLGTYGSALVAACAYDIEARRLKGDKARPNFAYPPPPDLVSAIAATPRRRRRSKLAPLAPPAPAPAPAPNLGESSDSFSSLALVPMESPAISVKNCFSTTVDPELMDSASFSISSPHLMLKKSNVEFAIDGAL